MFTGLIEDVGHLVARHAAGDAASLEVRTKLPADEIKVGDSIAVSGACLTVEAVRRDTGVLVFHTLSETLGRTSLGARPVGSLVNLERALRLGDRLGGHLVSGHVDTTAQLLRIERRADDLVLTVSLPDTIRALVIPKGSIAVDGISLTVAALQPASFSVHIIPHTWECTNLRSARVGDPVNLEADMLGKYILRWQQVAGTAAVSMDDLAKAGFV